MSLALVKLLLKHYYSFEYIILMYGIISAFAFKRSGAFDFIHFMNYLLEQIVTSKELSKCFVLQIVNIQL